MRIITQKAKSAFINGFNFSLSNTQVICESYNTNKRLYLHGNLILWTNQRGNLCFSLCGYNTNTTKDRLRAFFPLIQKKGILYFNNQEINAWDKYEITQNGAEKID